MQTHKLNEKAIAVTGLPEGAKPINIGYNTEGVFLWYKHGHRNYQLRLNVSGPWRTKKISWRILGFSQELTEEQWREVVEEHFLPFHNFESIGFEDYEYLKGMGTLETATESGHSLLKSKDLDPLLKHLILIQ